MPNLKKVISLNEASKISGYHSDYLSALIRKKELKGVKSGGSWFTTVEDINDYILRKKIRHKKWAFSEFFSSPTRRKRIIIWTSVILIAILFGYNFYNRKDQSQVTPVNTELSTEVEESLTL